MGHLTSDAQSMFASLVVGSFTIWIFLSSVASDDDDSAFKGRITSAARAFVVVMYFAGDGFIHVGVWAVAAHQLTFVIIPFVLLYVGCFTAILTAAFTPKEFAVEKRFSKHETSPQHLDFGCLVKSNAMRIWKSKQ